MAKTTTFGYTDTADGGATTKSLTRCNLNYSADFVAQDKSDKRFVGANKTSPIDQLETIRVQATDIPDVYKGTTIDPAVYAPSRKGLSLVCQVNDILRVTDTVDASFMADLPISCHIVMKVPSSSFITAAQVETVLTRAISLFYNSNSVLTDRIGSLLRGSTTPTGL